MNPVRLHQLYYLRSVLGLSRVIMPALERAFEPAPQDQIPPSVQERLSELCVMKCQPSSRLVVIGQAPAHTRAPFEGDRGELLSRMISAMKIPWSTVSLIEWHAQADHDVELLQAEVLALAPQSVLVLGKSEYFWGEAKPMGELFYFKNIPCLVTLDLSRLLTHPQDKKQAWEHLQKLMRALT